VALHSPINTVPKIIHMNKEITVQTFRQEVLNNTGLVIVQFHKHWNGACQIIAPIYEELARSYKGQADFFRVNIEEQKSLEKDFGITEVPTILFFRGGQVIDHSMGLVPRNILIHKVEKALSNHH
jgi:thioredoxin 1